MGPGSPTLHLLATLTVPLALACGGGDLLLPGGATPAELRIVSGDGQEARAGDPIPNPLVVEAVDQNGRPVEGARIHFRFAGAFGGGAVNPDTASTGESGRATAQVRLGDTPGGQVVEALALDGPSDLRARFVLRAIVPNPGGGGGGGGGDDEDDEVPDPDGGGGGGGGGGDDGGNGGGDNDGGNGGDGDDDDGSDRGRGGGGDDGDDDDRDDDDGDDDRDDDQDDEGGKGKGKDKGKGKGKGKGN